MVTELAVCGVWMRMDLKYSLPKPGGMPLGLSGYLCERLASRPWEEGSSWYDCTQQRVDSSRRK